MARASEFTVMLENRPGTLADLAEALGNANVNIDGLLATVIGDKGTARLVASDPQSAKQALDAAGIQYSTREVLLVTLEDKPGSLARMTRAIAKAGINLDAAYLTMGGKVVLGSTDVAGVEKVASSMGVL